MSKAKRRTRPAQLAKRDRECPVCGLMILAGLDRIRWRRDRDRRGRWIPRHEHCHGAPTSTRKSILRDRPRPGKAIASRETICDTCRRPILLGEPITLDSLVGWVHAGCHG